MLTIPPSKTKYRKNFFTCSTPKHWNMLKTSDINVSSVPSLKENIDKYIKNKHIYRNLERYSSVSDCAFFSFFVYVSQHVTSRL